MAFFTSALGELMSSAILCWMVFDFPSGSHHSLENGILDGDLRLEHFANVLHGAHLIGMHVTMLFQLVQVVHRGSLPSNDGEEHVII